MSRADRWGSPHPSTRQLARGDVGDRAVADYAAPSRQGVTPAFGPKVELAVLIDTDYLVVGAGASGLAFADALVAEADVEITVVDRQEAPGGHWQHVYPFVRLHSP